MLCCCLPRSLSAPATPISRTSLPLIGEARNSARVACGQVNDAHAFPRQRVRQTAFAAERDACASPIATMAGHGCLRWNEVEVSRALRCAGAPSVRPRGTAQRPRSCRALRSKGCWWSAIAPSNPALARDFTACGRMRQSVVLPRAEIVGSPRG